MTAWLPLLAIAVGAVDVPREVVTSAREAQARLAEALGDADAIESVGVMREGRGREVTVRFAIVRGGERQLVTATTTRTGAVASLSIEPVDAASGERHGLTWLAVELADVRAVVRLAAAEGGGLLLSTNDGRRYLVTPRRGPRTGNEGVEARWGAAWTSDGA